MTAPGRFIVVEGLEGAGKSTALQTLATYVKAQGNDVICTREPGGTRVGEVARQLLKEVIPDEPLDPRAELLLFYAARVQLVERVIRPALARGCWVIADRFELSTFAYQGGGRQLDEAMIQQLSSFCLEGFKPDITFFLDLPPEKGFERVHQRGPMDRIEQESMAFFNKIYDSYHRYIKNMPNVILIDATQPLASVQTALINELKKI